eukprot:SAG31_NODE_2190_length_6229_cov_11.374388_5_plen_334_part_00
MTVSLRSKAPAVMEFVEQACAANALDEATIRCGLDVIRNWGGGTGTDFGLCIVTVANSFGRLYALLFDLISTPLANFACESVVALVNNSSQLASQADLLADLVQRLVALQPYYESGLLDGDSDKCRNFLCIATSLASVTAEEILNGAVGDAGVALLEALFVGMQHPEVAIAEQALEFWSVSFPNKIRQCPCLHPSMQQQLHEKLFHATISRAMLPVHFKSWNPDESADLDEDEWGIFRQQLRDVLRHCCQFLGAGVLENCWQVLVRQYSIAYFLERKSYVEKTATDLAGRWNRGVNGTSMKLSCLPAGLLHMTFRTLHLQMFRRRFLVCLNGF